MNGDVMMALIGELYPICRSITGAGVRETLAVVGRSLDLDVHEVSSGTPVLDWVVPPEWNITEAHVTGPGGERLVDFADSSLHVVSYSEPVRARLTREDLLPHLHTLPDQPDAVPYRTSYYQRSWGFCLSQRQLDRFGAGPFDVVIDSTLAPGGLTYAEHVLPGELDEEVLISSHVCHPSLADDNLSGIAVAVALATWLGSLPRRRYTYRFVFAPGTIGAITWLAQHRDAASRIRHGLTLTCLGDTHHFTYKRTVGGDQVIDRAASVALRDAGEEYEIIDFFPYGYDERQYNSPGFRIPVGSLMRGRHGMFPEYHTSLDDLSFVSGAQLERSVDVLRTIVEVVEHDATYANLEPYGEPQLGARGLYASLGGTTIPDVQLAMLWVLNLSDGEHSLLAIAERSGLAFRAVAAAASVLAEHGLLAPAGGASSGVSPRR